MMMKWEEDEKERLVWILQLWQQQQQQQDVWWAAQKKIYKTKIHSSVTALEDEKRPFEIQSDRNCAKKKQEKKNETMKNC